MADEPSIRVSEARDSICVNGVRVLASEGWRVESLTMRLANRLVVELQLHAGGEEVGRHVVWWADEITPRTQGEQTRAVAVWSAIAAYLNSGGVLDDLRDAINAEQLDMLPVVSIPGWFLLETSQRLEPDQPRHVFAKLADTRELLSWEEGAYMEMHRALEDGTLLEISDDRTVVQSEQAIQASPRITDEAFASKVHRQASGED